MVFVFGVNLPVMELLFIFILFFVFGLVFMIWQVLKTSHHIRVLEDMTSEIRKYEQEEAEEIRRFETDVKNLESDEAELFLAKSLPTVTKLENFAASELLKGRDPKEVVGGLLVKRIKKELAIEVVNSVTFYLDFYGKLPKKQHDDHVRQVQQMKIIPPKGVSLPQAK